MVSKGHRTISPPKMTSFGTLGEPNTSSKQVHPKELAKYLWVTGPTHLNQATIWHWWDYVSVS